MTYRFFSRYTALLARKVPPAFQWDASRRMAAITASRPLIMLRMPGDARGATRLFHSDLEGGNKDALEPTTQTISRIQIPLDSGTHFIVKVPNLGNGITHGKIHQWHKIIGDSVEVGDLLCVIETDQVFGKVHSQVAGVIVEIVGNEGCKVRVGGDLTIIRKDDENDEEIDEE